MPTILSEDFNTGDGGWTTNADARDFTHVPLSGADGGYVEAFDRVSGDIWYFVGGAPFTGDLSLFAGGTLDYTIRQSSASSQFDAVDVILVGADRSIGFDFPIDQNPGTDWTDYSISLTALAGWFDLATDVVLTTDAEIAAVLDDLQALQIRGEYVTGPDSAQLDEVTLTSLPGAGGGGGGTGTPAPYRDGFATGDDGWRITADGQDARWIATGGKTNGYLQASDRPSGDVWFFKTPVAFSGDYSSFSGGSLNYSLFQTSLSSQFDDIDAKLIATDDLVSLRSSSPCLLKGKAGFGFSDPERARKRSGAGPNGVCTLSAHLFTNASPIRVRLPHAHSDIGDHPCPKHPCRNSTPPRPSQTN